MKCGQSERDGGKQREGEEGCKEKMRRTERPAETREEELLCRANEIEKRLKERRV